MHFKTDYRISREAFTKTKEPDRPWVVIEKAWNAYAECPDSQIASFLKRLTPGQRAFVALNGLEAEVNNGGIHQYFWNSTGNLFQEAIKGLKLLGADQHLQLLRKVLKLFRDPTVLNKRRSRQKVLTEIDADRMGRLFDEPFFRLEGRKRIKLDTLRLAYLRQHPEEFVLPIGQPEEKPVGPLPVLGDYRVKRGKVRKLRGEKLHWAVIKKLWDCYWEPLKGGKQEILDFLPRLSKGQRALTALAILKNAMRMNVGDLHHFFGSQAGADVLVNEVCAGLKLIGAQSHLDVFERAAQAAHDLPDLNRGVTEQSSVWDKAKEAGDEVAIEAARQAWRIAHNLRRKREDEIYDSLDALSQEFETLLETAEPRLDSCIETYVRTHPKDFFV